MKYQEKGIGSRQESVEFLRGLFNNLIKGQLTVEGNKVTLPDDKELEYKVKYDDDEAEGSISVKVTWTKIEELEEEDEEEEEI